MNSRYPSLDGLRAMAAICIVMMHVLSNMGASLSVVAFNPIVNSFTNFTFLFMMVSAFGMCCGYYEKFKEGKISLESFYKKRYTRILPFFSLLVFIDLVLRPSLPELYEGFADLTLAFGLLPNAGISVIGVGWFLGVIFVFYMIFPFFVFLMNDKKRAWFVFFVSIVLHFLAVTYFSRRELMVCPVGKWNIVYSFPFFVVGGLIFLYRQNVQRILNLNSWMAPALLSLVIVGYYILPPIHLFSELFVFAMFVSFAISRTEKGGLLNNSIASFISNVSMEIYLCHMLFFRGVSMLHLENYISNEDALFVVSFLLTFFCALLFSLCWKKLIEPRILYFFERN